MRSRLMPLRPMARRAGARRNLGRRTVQMLRFVGRRPRLSASRTAFQDFLRRTSRKKVLRRAGRR
ncbi:hypothetical protein QM565_11710, partial [Geitlerinema splendidum]|nr:hypothetical protein [Geitlerinema splendidum]